MYFLEISFSFSDYMTRSRLVPSEAYFGRLGIKYHIHILRVCMRVYMCGRKRDRETEEKRERDRQTVDLIVDYNTPYKRRIRASERPLETCLIPLSAYWRHSPLYIYIYICVCVCVCLLVGIY